MTELATSALIAVVVLAGAGALLRSEWRRTRCAYQTFEAAHARLVGGRFPGAGVVSIEEDEEKVSGEAHCGSARESVSFAKLEHARW